MSLAAHVEAIGIAAPGLADWPATAAILRGESAYVAGELGMQPSALLPANERRRATLAVKLAFRAAEEAVRGRDASDLATVFASSDADMNILHRVCSALATPERMVSPTDFHNSVHNAAAGYWGIGVGARAPSTTLAGFDGSFGLGLLEAALQVATERRPVLLVVFDVPAPEPLLRARPMALPASCALWLAPERSATTLASLDVGLSGDPETTLESHDDLRRASTALRALPLLRAIARREAVHVVLPSSGARALRVDVRP